MKTRELLCREEYRTAAVRECEEIKIMSFEFLILMEEKYEYKLPLSNRIYLSNSRLVRQIGNSETSVNWSNIFGLGITERMNRLIESQVRLKTSD